jgi:hypothetical protein
MSGKDESKGFWWRLPVIESTDWGKLGPGFGFGIGCGVGLGAGFVGGTFSIFSPLGINVLCLTQSTCQHYCLLVSIMILKIFSHALLR